MIIKILDNAKKDLKAGFIFYERQNEGLGSYFLDSLFSDIDSLYIYAGIHSRHYKKYYRLLSKRFPFAIYYRIEKKIIYIDAVLDCRRDPAWIRNKIENPGDYREPEQPA